MTRVTDFFKLIRIVNLLIIALSLSLFYYLIIVPVHHNILVTDTLPFSTLQFILFVLSIVCIAAGGNIINDYFDLELDREFKPERPLAKAAISLDMAMYLHVAFALTGVGLGFFISWQLGNYKIGYIYVISAVLLYVYSSSLKRLPLVGNIVVAGLTGFVFFLLLLFEGNFLLTKSYNSGEFAFNILMWQAKFYGGFAFLINLAREIVKDIEDRQGDAEYRIDTIAVQFGAGVAKWVAIAVLLLALAGLGFFMYTFYISGAEWDFYYLLVAVVLPILAVMGMLVAAKTNEQYYRAGMGLKLVMFTGILSIPAFYFFHNYLT